MGNSTPSSIFNVAQRFDILARDDFTCRYCGAKPPLKTLEVDHVIPRSLGGKATMDNGVTACGPCNKGKRDKLIQEIERVPVAASNVMIRALFEEHARSVAQESERRHRYRRQLWRELVRKYHLDFEDVVLREGIAEAAMEWGALGVPMELPVAIFGEVLHWASRKMFVTHQDTDTRVIASRFVTEVGAKIHDSMEAALAEPCVMAPVPDNVHSINHKRDQKSA